MSLDVGTLRATLQLDGADEFRQGTDGAREGMQQLGQAAQAGARQAGIAFSQTSAEAKKLADAAVAGAEKGVQARNREKDAAERLRRAEVDLGKARQSGDAEKLTRAEADLERARRNHETAARRATAAERDGVEALEAYRRAAQQAEQAHNQLGDTVSRTNPFQALTRQARESGQEAGENLAEGMPAPIAAAVRAAGPVGVAIAAVAVVGVGVGKILADNIIAGMEKQALANRDAARFGWTDQQAAEAGKAAAAAYGNAWGDSVASNRETVGIAIQAGLIDGNATAAEIQPVIEKIATLNETMGVDTTEAAKAAGQMIRTGLVKDASEAFDLVQRAQEKGLNLDGDLLETINEYSTQWRKLGIDGATALGTIQQMTRAGARDTDIAADALKEFSIRVIDGSKASNGALEALGLPVEEFRSKIAAGGQTALGASQTIIMALAGVRDEAKRNELGAALLGSQWEDLGGAIDTLDLSNARNEFGSFNGAVDEAQQKMGGTASDIESAKRQIELSMGEVQVKLAETFGPHLAEAAQWVSEHTDEISRAFEIAGGVVTTVGGAIGMVAGTIIGSVGEAIEYTAKLVRGVLGPIFTGMEKLGGLMAKMPGQAGELGTALQKGAAGGRAWIDTWVEAGEATSDFGWGMASVSTSITQAGIDLTAGTDKAKTATQAFGDLGIKVREVPDEKRIVIEDNSPETKAKLEELGIKVQTLPDGTVYIDAQDEDAKAKIAEITKPETKQVTVQVTEARTGSFEVRDRDGKLVTQAPAQDTKIGPPGKSSGGVGSRANADGTTTHTRGGKVLDANGKPTGESAKQKPAVPETAVRKTSEELEDEQKAKDKADKAAASSKAKTDKEQAAAAKKAADAQAKIPGLESALAIAEQKVRELKPNATASSRMSADQAVTKAREALEKARSDAQGATSTGADGKPVTVTGDGKGGTVQVGTGSAPLKVEPSNGAQGDGLRVFVTNMPAGGIGGGLRLSLFANGGVEDHRAQIARGGDMRLWAEPETDGEAYIPFASSKRAGSMAIMQQVAARFGQRLVPFKDGGIADRGITGGTVAFGNVSGAGITKSIQQDAWDTIRQQFPSAVLSSATRTQDVGSGFDFHMAGEALDISGSAELMMQIAEWIASNYPNSRELIHGPGFAKQIKDGKVVGDGGGSYGFYAGAGRHDDHVHWTPPTGFAFGGGGAQQVGVAQLAGVGALTAQSTQKEIAAAIIGEAKKRGYSDEEARAILATAMQESDLKMQDGGGGAWKGIFQQDGSYAGRDDPNTNISGFFDRLDEKRKGAPGGDIWKDIFWLQQRPGETSAAAAFANGRQDYLSEIQSKLDPADNLMREVLASMPSVPTSGAPAAPQVGAGTKGGVVDVRVTNWPSNLGASNGGVRLSLFANGGIEDHTAQIARGGDMRLWAEPETGGEAYIPFAPSKRPRSIALWHETGRRLGVTGFANGGISLPKIETPKIDVNAPTFMPGGPLPVNGAPAAPSSPLDALGISTGSGTPGGTDRAAYAQQRLTQLGVDLVGIAKDAAIQTLVPGGTLPGIVTNSIGLMKSVGDGIRSSQQSAQTTSTTTTQDGGQTVNNYNTTINATNTDEAFREWQVKQNRDALAFEGKIP